MNVRKPVDYSTMFRALDNLMAASLPQMELYREIGRLVSARPEKGAAVATVCSYGIIRTNRKTLDLQGVGGLPLFFFH